jgi:peroxiredoxin
LSAACAAGSGQSPRPAVSSPGAAATTTPAAVTVTPAASVLVTPPASPTAAASPVPTGASSADPSPAPAGPAFSQPWATSQLTDVTTGEQFTLAELAGRGKVVFVETMAIWCANCRAQQREAVSAFAELDPSRVEWVGLDVESTETADALARYREQNGFPFRYAIASADLSRQLASEFGDLVLSPPSVNLVILGADGTVTHLTGHHSAAELVTVAQEHGA